MPNSWFDPKFLSRYNDEILPFVQDKLDEGTNLRDTVMGQKFQRRQLAAERRNTKRQGMFISSLLKRKHKEETAEGARKDAMLGTGDYFEKKASTEIDGERFRVNLRRKRKEAEGKRNKAEQIATHAEQRGQARAMDKMQGQPIHKPYYEAVEHIFENKESGKTRKTNDMFRGLSDFRKDLRLSTKISLTGDPKEKDKLRKREERKLNEYFSIQSQRLINEQEEETPEADQQPEEGQEQGQEGTPGEVPVPMDPAIVFEQLKQIRSKVKNVFENLSNISYKIMTEKLGVKSENKDDRDFQNENAIITISRVCSGASPEELQYMGQFQNGRLFDFNEEAFDTARKLLLELGESCFQNLMHIDELGIMPDAPGFERSQLICNQSTFKIVVGKTYVKESTTSPNYGVKLKNVINSMVPMAIPADPNIKQYDQIDMFLAPMRQELSNFSIYMVDDQNPELLANPQVAKILAKYNIIDQNGMIYEQAKLSNFMNLIKTYTDQIGMDKNLFYNTFFFQNMINLLTRYFIAGINTMDPRANATHLLTDSGLFLINDQLIGEFARKAEVKLTPKKTPTGKGRRTKGSKLSKNFENLKTIVEEVKDEMQTQKIDESMIVINTMDLLQNIDTIVYQQIMENFDVDINISLNPGNEASSSEKKQNEYNIVKIKNKEVKIPVVMDKGDMSTKTIKESRERLENIILEKLTGYEKKYSEKTSHHRSNRNKARRAAEKKFGAAAIKGKDVDHKDGNPMNNSPSNLRLRSPGDNRADNGHHKGEPYKKAKRGITNTYKGKDK